MPLRFGDGCGRDVFELKGDDVDTAGERAHGVEVVVGRVDLFVGDLAGRCVVVGCQRVDAIAEPAGRHGEHAPKLTATQDADGRTGQYHSEYLLPNVGSVLVAVRLQLRPQVGPRRRENGDREERRVRSARRTDGDGGHRHALRHLDN